MPGDIVLLRAGMVSVCALGCWVLGVGEGRKGKGGDVP